MYDFFFFFCIPLCEDLLVINVYMEAHFHPKDEYGFRSVVPNIFYSVAPGQWEIISVASSMPVNFLYLIAIKHLASIVGSMLNSYLRNSGSSPHQGS